MTQAPQKAPYTTNNAGIPVESDEHSLTVGPDGPILLQDHYLIEKMAQFNRERVPERVVHAKGSGAYGFFEVTNDVSQFTKADLFQPGKRTEMLARFSTVAGEQGSPDTWRDPRGFALKFYTEQGNYDLVGNNTPIFFVRDTIKFQDFIRSQKRRPDNGLRDNDMQWDFWTLSPESAHQVTYLMGDRGIPKTYRNMNGYGSHTYMWINGAGERFWVKYHFKTDQGIDFLTQAEADELAGTDPDLHRMDLYKAIESGNAPSWSLKVQIMPFEDAADYRFNPFDLTKIWPHGDYPLIDVGRMTSTGTPRTTSSTSSRPPSSRPTWCRASALAGQDAARPTVLLSGHTVTGSARTTPSCRRTARTPRRTRTPRTARCVTSRRSRPARTRPTPTAAPRPTSPASATRRAGRPRASWCARRTSCTARTTTGASRARWSARSSTTRPATAWSRTSPAT